MTKRENRVEKVHGRHIQTIMDTFKHRIRTMLRGRVGHFPEVCRETGLSRELISKMHNGLQENPTLESVVRVAEACGYTVQFQKKDEAKFKDRRNRAPARAAPRRRDLDKGKAA